MKVIFLFPYPLKKSPSQRFRFEQYFVKLEEQKIQYECFPFWNLYGWEILYSKGQTIKKTLQLVIGLLKRCIILFKISSTDFVFIHRECAPIGPPIVEWVIAKVLRKKIIYDFDDAIWIPNTSSENMFAARLKWHSKVKSIIQWSHKISCGNDYLADYALQFNRNVTINPTTIDTDYHNTTLQKVVKDPSITTIGWTGTHSTIKYLEPIIPIVIKLEKLYSIRLLIIANKKPEFQTETLEYIHWNYENEISDLLKFDIGLMPLTNDLWANGKCGFKALQYMALGIPTVASPVGVNTKIITHEENGYLCDKGNEWLETLEFLITNPHIRLKVGNAAMQKVKNDYSVFSNSGLFLSLFS